MKLNNREKEQTEEDLASLELYIRNLWEFLPLPLCYLTPKYFILQVNNKFTEISGYSPAEIVGEDVEKLFLEKDGVTRFKKEINKKDKIEGEELTFITKGGEKIPVEISIAGRRSPEGEFFGCFLAIIDISDIKYFQQKLEMKVEEKTKELEEKVKILEKFQRLVVRREEKMIELKKENKRLKEKINQP